MRLIAVEIYGFNIACAKTYPQELLLQLDLINCCVVLSTLCISTTIRTRRPRPSFNPRIQYCKHLRLCQSIYRVTRNIFLGLTLLLCRTSSSAACGRISLVSSALTIDRVAKTYQQRSLHLQELVSSHRKYSICHETHNRRYRNMGSSFSVCKLLVAPACQNRVRWLRQDPSRR